MSSTTEWSAYHTRGQSDGWMAPPPVTDEDSDPRLTTSEMTKAYGGLEVPEPYYPQSQKRNRSARDENVNVKVNKDRLTWRLDPDESLSDWTLSVVSNPDLNPPEEDDYDDDDDRDEDVQERNEDEDINRSTKNNGDGEDGGEEEKQPTSSSHNKLRHRTKNYPTKKYFVHRTVLAVGQRRSEYFGKLFLDQQRKLASGKKSSRSTNGTRIELRPAAANAFPLMLDYIYSDNNTPLQGVCSETAVALRHLATCFGIRPLFDDVTLFIQDDLCPETSPTYLWESHQFQHEKLFSAALQLCAQNFAIIQFRLIVTKLNPPLFEQVVTSPHLSCSSEALSIRIASYCRCRPGAIDASSLQRLTNVELMPRVAPEEAIFFLQLISEVEEDSDEDISLGGRQLHRTKEKNGRKSQHENAKNTLYDRCIKASGDIVMMAIGSYGSSTGNLKQKGNHRKQTNKAEALFQNNRQARNAAKEYHALPPIMKIDALENALLAAPNPQEVAELEEAKKKAENKLADEARSQLHLMEDEVDRLSRKYEKKIANLEARMQAQEEELQAYATELSRFRRVPNSYPTGGVAAKYSYQQLQEFPDSGEVIYGEEPPTSMPRFGNQSEDGLLFPEESLYANGQKARNVWPMFYYKGDMY